MKHKGFAYLEVLQACPTYNKLTPDAWYAERVRDVEGLKGYDRGDIWAARRLVEDIEKDIYIGLLYENKQKLDFLSLQENRKGVETALVDEVKEYEVEGFLG